MSSKVKFIACDMPTANDLTIQIMAAFAEDEAKRISKRTTDAIDVIKTKLRNGEQHVSKAGNIVEMRTNDVAGRCESKAKVGE